jgi:hypothetical protein
MNGIVIGKNGSGALPPTYQYIMKPSKIKTIAKPLLSSGVSGEKMSLNPAIHYKPNLHSNSVNSAALHTNLNALNIENSKNSLILPSHYNSSTAGGNSIHSSNNIDMHINGS